MNKKYMDFVPKSAPRKTEKPSPKIAPTEVKSKVEPKKELKSEPKVEPKKESKPALMVPARPAFVNTEKIRKRPLSKSTAPKKEVIPKEETPSAPVTIIDKPEKDSKVGLIVTIIITIILGAAAGTVAFLLLPK